MEITNLQLQRQEDGTPPVVTLFVNALAVFVGRQIGVQVNGLAA
jgi:hypothetical protein